MRPPPPDSPARSRCSEAARRFWQQPGLPRWFSGCSRILVGVSGGADSMALLYLLAHPDRPAWAPRLVAGHVHHGMRGADADADARCAARLAEELGVPCRLRKIDGPRLVQEPGGSPENALRQARFAALRDILRRNRCDALVLAHHQDDLAETFLIRLLRGSGIAGLAAFGPTADLPGLRIVRPLIDWPRSDLRRLLKDARIEWAEDRSNRDPAYLRNRVRRTLLPCIERLTDHPPAARILARTARLLERENRALLACVETVYQRHRVERSEPRRIALPRQVLLEDGSVFAPHLLRRMLDDLLDGAYPPDAARIAEMERFTAAARPGALLQTYRNAVLHCDREERIWMLQKPRRLMSRAEILQLLAGPG